MKSNKNNMNTLDRKPAGAKNNTGNVFVQKASTGTHSVKEELTLKGKLTDTQSRAIEG